MAFGVGIEGMKAAQERRALKATRNMPDAERAKGAANADAQELRVTVTGVTYQRFVAGVDPIDGTDPVRWMG